LKVGVIGLYFLGIDLGGTKIAAGIVDENYNIIIKDSLPTLAQRTADEIADDIGKLSMDIISRAGISASDIKWAGIGSPGTVNCETGIIEYANNLPFKNLPMKKMLEERLGMTVYIENDANAAAYGEFMAGAAKGANSAVCITLGTGVGSGIIIDGRVYHGFNFAGAELGHTVIVVNGREDTCGRKGCLEAYASATGLIKMTREAMLRDKQSIMWKSTGGDPEKVSGRTAFDAMRAGDGAGKAVVDEYLFYLGAGLANVVNIFQPEVLCIGGGISKEGDGIIKPLEAIIEKERYSKYAARQTRLCTATLGNDAGIIGAALVGLMYEKA
jgi:glucokinase